MEPLTQLCQTPPIRPDSQRPLVKGIHRSQTNYAKSNKPQRWVLRAVRVPDGLGGQAKADFKNDEGHVNEKIGVKGPKIKKFSV